jgi:hypothetical protein
MDNCRRVLVMERKPTASGATSGKIKPVGGEVYPANLLQLTTANLIWILLLLAPIFLVYIFAKRGQRLPSPVRTMLTLIPAAARVFT